MSNLAIQKHNFDKATQNIKRFAEKIPSSVNLPTVATEEGLFGWFDHKATGAELNDLTSKVQNYLITINNLLVENTKEFGQVYKAFDALDREYINAILTTIKAAEKASDQAKAAANKANDNTGKIERTVDVLKSTMESYMQIKEKIEKLKHLKDIDEMYNATKELETEFACVLSSIEKQAIKVETQLASHDKKVANEFAKQTDQQKKALKTHDDKMSKEVASVNDSLQKFENKINDVIKKQTSEQNKILQEHGDKMAEEVASVNSSLQKTESKINDELEKQASELDKAFHTHKNEVAGEIKSAGDNLLKIKDELTSEINEKLQNKLAAQTEELAKIIELITDQKNQNNLLAHKVKIAYIIAGGSVGITLLNTLLNILGVL